MRPTTRLSVRLGAVVTAVAAMFAALLWAMPAAAAGQVGPRTDGFVLMGGDGGIFTFNVPMAGAAASDPTRCPPNVTDRIKPNGTCSSLAMTPSGMGYWILNGDTGKIYPYGTAGFYGDPAAKFVGVGREFVPNMLQIVPTPSGKGYWVYESGLSGLGTVDHFGDAGSFGDTIHLVHGGAGFKPNGFPVALVATADGKGYWEVWSDGGVFSFGDAKFYGSAGGLHLAQRIVGAAATADGKGYWLVAADGGVFSYGDAKFGGSAGGLRLVAPIVGMVRNPAGPGYWLAAADGGIFGFGGAPWIGSLVPPAAVIHLHSPIVAIAAKRTAIG